MDRDTQRMLADLGLDTRTAVVSSVSTRDRQDANVRTTKPSQMRVDPKIRGAIDMWRTFHAREGASEGSGVQENVNNTSSVGVNVAQNPVSSSNGVQAPSQWRFSPQANQKKVSTSPRRKDKHQNTPRKMNKFPFSQRNKGTIVQPNEADLAVIKQFRAVGSVGKENKAATTANQKNKTENLIPVTDEAHASFAPAEKREFTFAQDGKKKISFAAIIKDAAYIATKPSTNNTPVLPNVAVATKPSADATGQPPMSAVPRSMPGATLPEPAAPVIKLGKFSAKVIDATDHVARTTTDIRIPVEASFTLSSKSSNIGIEHLIMIVEELATVMSKMTYQVMPGVRDDGTGLFDVVDDLLADLDCANK